MNVPLIATFSVSRENDQSSSCNPLDGLECTNQKHEKPYFTNAHLDFLCIHLQFCAIIIVLLFFFQGFGKDAAFNELLSEVEIVFAG